MDSKSLMQVVKFKAEPKAVYDALMDSKKHSEFTGSKCVIGKKVGDSFSTYDEYSKGKNLELIPNKKIVQLWRASDWPEGHYSEIVFEFEKTNSGTTLHFKQSNLPAGSVKEFEQGWKDFYWEPMKKYFEE